MACLALQLEPFLTTDEDRLNEAAGNAPRPMRMETLRPQDFLSP